MLNRNAISHAMVKLHGRRPEGLPQKISGVCLDVLAVLTGPENSAHTASAVTDCSLNLNHASVYRSNDIGSVQTVDFRAGHCAEICARTN